MDVLLISDLWGKMGAYVGREVVNGADFKLKRRALANTRNIDHTQESYKVFRIIRRAPLFKGNELNIRASKMMVYGALWLSFWS